MVKLTKYKIELEVCAPEHSTCEDVYAFISSIARDSDVAEINDVFAIGNIEVVTEGAVTVDEWNGDAVDEAALAEFE